MTSTETKEHSDEVMRKLLKPHPSGEQVLLALQKAYAEEGQEIKFVKELVSYDDANYMVEIDTKRYLAKVHNGVESQEFIKSWKEGTYKKSVIHLQNAMMSHLGQNGVSTTTPVMPLSGFMPTPASIYPFPVASEEHSPCELVVRLLDWVEGIPMSSVDMLPIESLADAGRYLGRLSKTLGELDTSELAAAKRHHQWDGKNTVELRDFYDCIQDRRRKALVEDIINTFEKELITSKVAESFPTSLIHGDFNDANMIMDSNYRVSGAIDFGDSVESWRVLDLTIAMTYAMLCPYGKRQRSISAAAAVLRGYNSVCPLTPEERKHLVLLVACRLACSATLGTYTFQQNPENEYLLLHAMPAWEALDLIWGTDAMKREEMGSVLNSLFDQACSVQVDLEAEVIDCTDLSFPDPTVRDPFKDIRASQEPEDASSGRMKRRRNTFR